MFPSCLIKLQNDVETLSTSINQVSENVAEHKIDTTTHPDISVANSTKWNSSHQIVSSIAPTEAIGEIGDICFQTL